MLRVPDVGGSSCLMVQLGSWYRRMLHPIGWSCVSAKRRGVANTCSRWSALEQPGAILRAQCLWMVVGVKGGRHVTFFYVRLRNTPIESLTCVAALWKEPHNSPRTPIKFVGKVMCISVRGTFLTPRRCPMQGRQRPGK
jgi:hypothetical protein